MKSSCHFEQAHKKPSSLLSRGSETCLDLFKVGVTSHGIFGPMEDLILKS